MGKGNEQALVGIHIDERRFGHMPEDRVLITKTTEQNYPKVIRNLINGDKRLVAFLLRDFHGKNGDRFELGYDNVNSDRVIWTPESEILIPEVYKFSVQNLDPTIEELNDAVRRKILQALFTYYSGKFEKGVYSEVLKRDNLDVNYLGSY